MGFPFLAVRGHEVGAVTREWPAIMKGIDNGFINFLQIIEEGRDMHEVAMEIMDVDDIRNPISELSEGFFCLTFAIKPRFPEEFGPNVVAVISAFGDGGDALPGK